jgi:hypothetical protein
MTTERRLAKIEASLGPKELVLRWPAEAHAYDTFVAYARSTYAMGPEGLPLDRILRETIDWVEATYRGRSREDRDEGRRTGLRQVLFLFHLVLRSNVLAQETLDREVLIHAAFSAHLGLAAIDTEDGKRSAVPTHASRLDMVRTSLFLRVSELLAMEQARSQLEAKYLDGHAALFPATIRDWAEQLQRTKQLAVMAERLAELDGLDPFPLEDPNAFGARVERLVADHVEPARMKALDDMGEGARAMAIAVRWLESRFG